MCQSCVEIDKAVEAEIARLRSTSDPAELKRINRLIVDLYAERLRLHRNSEEGVSYIVPEKPGARSSTHWS